MDTANMQDDSCDSPQQHLHFVTGRLAASAVRSIVDQLAREVGFAYSIDVLPITVAALMTGKWMLRHLQIAPQATRVILPGYLESELEFIRGQVPIAVDCGPRDIRELPVFFGKNSIMRDGYGAYRIEILAEINHAAQLPRDELLAQALQLKSDGADVIDVGCQPGRVWSEVGDAVRALCDAGLRVSIDSFDAHEVALAVKAGAELVLSVNSQNCRAAIDWGVEVVAIPDLNENEKKFFETAEFLLDQRVATRLDPIIEPIGCGLAGSLQRYFRCRERFPQVPMMMGIGNITELTDVDSAGINVLLLGLCEELQIASVLTTQVINWSRTSVRECDIARRLVHHACQRQIPPKHLDESLLLLRDSKLLQFPNEMFTELAQSIRDHNLRMFAQDQLLHLVTSGLHLRATDPFQLFQDFLKSEAAQKMDVAHAFYVGYELAKAFTALTLGKNYIQDEELHWGFLTRHRKQHRILLKDTPNSCPNDTLTSSAGEK